MRGLRWGIAVFALFCGASAASAMGDDRGTTESLLKEVETSPRKDVAQEMVGRSRAALDRAGKLRAAGDESHAKLADGLALSWATAARDVVKAADVEDRAATLRRNATDAGAMADRERALLEEGVAQTGRLRAQLEQVNKETTAPRTSSAAKETDAGAPPKVPAPARDGGVK